MDFDRMDDAEDDLFDSKDVIQEFLQSKLNLVKSKREDLEQQLERRKTLLEEAGKREVSGLVIGEVWKKILNGNCVFGIAVTNNEKVPIHDIDVFLTGCTNTPLRYTIKIFECQQTKDEDLLPDTSKQFLEQLRDRWGNKQPTTKTSSSRVEGEWFLSSEIKVSAQILVVFALPEFVARNSYEFDGIISYLARKIKEVQFPKLKVEAADVLNEPFVVKRNDLIRGDLQSFLACLAVQQEYTLFVSLPADRIATFENVLEIDCSFTMLNVKSSSRFYVASANLESLDRVIVEVKDRDEDNEKILVVHFRDAPQLIALVHHVHLSIPGVVVLPYEDGTTLKTSQTNLLPANVLRNYILRLGDSLEKELKFVKKYFDQHIDQVAKGTEQESPVVINEAKGYKNFRMTLAELENESDQLFDKIVVHEEEVVPEEDILMDLN